MYCIYRIVWSSLKKFKQIMKKNMDFFENHPFAVCCKIGGTCTKLKVDMSACEWTSRKSISSLHIFGYIRTERCLPSLVARRIRLLIEVFSDLQNYAFADALQNCTCNKNLPITGRSLAQW